MNAGLRSWWPALPAALILYWGASDFINRYPRAKERPAERLAGGGPDSLLSYARAFAADSVPRPEADADNPFRPIHPPKAQAAPGAASRVRTEPPPRKYVLRGTVGRDVATIANNAGEKMIVKAGDRIDSADVVSIEPNRVVLKDRAGKFELQTEK
jgi:hypothetical protein